MRPRGREEEIETARRERGCVDGRGARAYVGKAVEPPCMTSLRTKPRWLGKREEDERRRGGAWTRGRHFPDETSPSAGAGRTDGRGQGQGTAVRSVPPHEAAAARKERRAARREAACKLKLFGFKFSDKNLFLTIPQKGAGVANVANVVHPADAPTGRPAAPPHHEDLERTRCC